MKQDKYDNMVLNIAMLLEEAQMVSGKLHKLKNKLVDGEFPIYISNNYEIPTSYDELGAISQVAMITGRIRAEIIMQNAILDKLAE